MSNMSVTLSRTAAIVRKAYAPAPQARRAEFARKEAPAHRTTQTKAPAELTPPLGYLGLQQALAHLPAAASAVPATLLTAVIHTMGGAATSVARGLYVNTAI
jgi:hypothetical protein